MCISPPQRLDRPVPPHRPHRGIHFDGGTRRSSIGVARLAPAAMARTDAGSSNRQASAFVEQPRQGRRVPRLGLEGRASARALGGVQELERARFFRPAAETAARGRTGSPPGGFDLEHVGAEVSRDLGCERGRQAQAQTAPFSSFTSTMVKRAQRQRRSLGPSPDDRRKAWLRSMSGPMLTGRKPTEVSTWQQTGNHKGLTFGIFLAPFHRGRREPHAFPWRADMELVEWIDGAGLRRGLDRRAPFRRLGKPSPPPEVFIGAAIQRTRYIRLGSGRPPACPITTR